MILVHVCFFFRLPSQVTRSPLSAPSCILRDVLSFECNYNFPQIFCFCLQLHLHTTHCHGNFLRLSAPERRVRNPQRFLVSGCNFMLRRIFVSSHILNFRYFKNISLLFTRITKPYLPSVINLQFCF